MLDMPVVGGEIATVLMSRLGEGRAGPGSTGGVIITSSFVLDKELDLTWCGIGRRRRDRGKARLGICSGGPRRGADVGGDAPGSAGEPICSGSGLGGGSERTDRGDVPN